MAGTFTVTMALFSYSIAIIHEQRTSHLSPSVIAFLSLGICLDISATLLMIIGSQNSPFTFHGFLGYIALLGLLVETILLWKLKIKFGMHAAVPKKIHLYSRYSYIFWVLTYATGGLFAILLK